MIWNYPGPAQISIRASLFEPETKLESEATVSGLDAKRHNSSRKNKRFVIIPLCLSECFDLETKTSALVLKNGVPGEEDWGVIESIGSCFPIPSIQCGDRV
jgi:hypothetical protein